MANRSPGFVQVTTTSTGSGPYTLTNTVPLGVDYRSIANAVADGSLSSGDTVHYVIFQTGAPTGKMFERGWGTINTTTLVLTVVSVIERSAALSSGGWGAGTKDVYFAPPGVEGVAILSLVNTFLAQQVITLGGSSPSLNANTALSVQKSGSGNDCRLSIIGNSTGNAQLGMGDEGAEFLGRVVYYGSLHATKPNVMEFFTNNAVRMSLSATGVLSDASAKKYVAFPGGGVVKQLFGSAPPTGWTRVNETDDRVIKTAKSSENAGDSGGSWTVSGLTVTGSTEGTTLTLSEIPAHHHTKEQSLGSGGSSVGWKADGSGVGSAASTSDDGASSPHSHSLGASASIASSGAWRPLYKVWVMATFD